MIEYKPCPICHKADKVHMFRRMDLFYERHDFGNSV